MDATNANQQADQAAFPYPAGVLPPAHEQTDTTGETTTAGTNTEQKSLSPVQQQAEAAQDTAAQSGIALTGEQRAQKEREGAVTADMARRAELAGQGFANETEKAYAESQKMIDAARARAQVAQQRLDNTPPAKFFRDGDTWGNALRGFALALGAAGDAKQVGAAVRTGHAAPTLDTVHDIVQTDLDKQKAVIADLSDRVVKAHTGIDDAFKARQQMLQDIDMRGAAAYAQLERIGRARLAALGMSQPEIDQHAAIQAIQEKRAEAHAKYVEPLFDTISKHIETAKRKDAAVTERTQQPPATAILGAPGLAADLKTVGGYQPGVLEGVTPNALKDSEGQQYDAASDRLAMELAAKKVGPRAASNPEVVKEIRAQYIPSATDKPETRAAKLGALQQELNAETYGQVGRQLAPPAAAPAKQESAKSASKAAPVPASPPPAADRATMLRQGSALLEKLRAAGDPRAAAVEARLRAMVRGGG